MLDWGIWADSSPFYITDKIYEDRRSDKTSSIFCGHANFSEMNGGTKSNNYKEGG